MTDDKDQVYLAGAAAAGKVYMAGITSFREQSNVSMVAMVPYSLFVQELDL